MGRRYTLREAQELLPQARQRVLELATIVEDLRRLQERLRAGDSPDASSVDVALLTSQVDSAVAWFDAHAVRVTSLDPALLDFPALALRDGEAVEVLLCWRDDEDTIAYYHGLEDGYRGREPVAMLDRV